MFGKQLTSARRFLERARNGDASWPYMPGRSGAVEPTCYAAIMLGSVDSIRWLESAASLQWEKCLALLAATRAGGLTSARERLVNALMEPKVTTVARSEIVNLDTTLNGWAWVDNTFSWVEPTSYALVALKAAGIRQHPRIAEAERLLLDRVCFDGGWNYGNREVLGQQLASMAPTTAIAAMALQGAPGSEAVIGRALDLLIRDAAAHPSALSLSLTTLCLAVHGRSCGEIAARLAARQQDDGSWRNNVHLTALSGLALIVASGGDNVFRI